MTALTRDEVQRMVYHEAVRQGVDPTLAMKLAWQESRFNPDARSPAGAIGVMQLMPGTADDLGVDPTDVGDNIKGGVRYLKQQLQRFRGDTRLALAAYNAGPGAVQKYGDVPRTRRRSTTSRPSWRARDHPRP
jgi:soluble lytic murein transglycosylase-like protein